MLNSVLSTLFFFSFEDELQTTHLPEMVFGESFLSLQHTQTGMKFHFNALDALKAWKKEALPPVEVPAAAKWKFRRSSITVLPFFFTQFILPSICSERCWLILASLTLFQSSPLCLKIFEALIRNTDLWMDIIKLILFCSYHALFLEKYNSTHFEVLAEKNSDNDMTYHVLPCDLLKKPNHRFF